MARTQRDPSICSLQRQGLNLRFYFPASCIPWRPLPRWHATHRAPGPCEPPGVSTGPLVPSSATHRPLQRRRCASLRATAHEHPVFLILISRQARWMNLPHRALALIAPGQYVRASSPCIRTFLLDSQVLLILRCTPPSTLEPHYHSHADCTVAERYSVQAQ
jgi:hypothetical protein